MAKFFVLFKKELRELLAPQTLVPLFAVVLVFALVGTVVSEESEKALTSPVAVLDLDASPTSREVVGRLEARGFAVERLEAESVEQALKEMNGGKVAALIAIPPGFGQGLAGGRPQEIEAYTVLRSFSVVGAREAHVLESALAAINDELSNALLQARIPGVPPQFLKNPVARTDVVVIGEKMARVSPGEVLGFITSQMMFIPVIMFVVIVVSAQMIAAAIASEKENKTLEILLSAPLSRSTIVLAKMIAAGVTSLLTTALYMVGFRSYLGGTTGGFGGDMGGGTEVLADLGLKLTSTGYLLIGTSLLLSVLIGLAVSILLGALSEDAKSAQGLTAPIIFLVMLPYFLVIFLDIGKASPLLKFFVYALPFSYSFLALPLLYTQNLNLLIGGILYQGAVCAVLVLAASRVFSSEKILTARIGWTKRQSLHRLPQPGSRSSR